MRIQSKNSNKSPYNFHYYLRHIATYTLSILGCTITYGDYQYKHLEIAVDVWVTGTTVTNNCYYYPHFNISHTVDYDDHDGEYVGLSTQFMAYNDDGDYDQSNKKFKFFDQRGQTLNGEHSYTLNWATASSYFVYEIQVQDGEGSLDEWSVSLESNLYFNGNPQIVVMDDIEYTFDISSYDIIGM